MPKPLHILGCICLTCQTNLLLFLYSGAHITIFLMSWECSKPTPSDCYFSALCYIYSSIQIWMCPSQPEKTGGKHVPTMRACIYFVLNPTKLHCHGLTFEQKGLKLWYVIQGCCGLAGNWEYSRWALLKVTYYFTGWVDTKAPINNKCPHWIPTMNSHMPLCPLASTFTCP